MASSPTIIFINLPHKTFVGIDLTSFNSSPNFHGITNLPPGLHFIYTGTDTSLSIRHGRWLNIEGPRPGPHVLHWNNDLEHLELLSPDTTTAQEVSRRLPELHRRGLIDYHALKDASAKQAKSQSASLHAADEDEAESEGENEEPEDPWPTLTSHISPRLLNRVLTPHDQTTDWTLTSISSAPSDTEHIPGLSSVETQSALADTQTLNVLPVDLKQTWSVHAVGRQRTDMARDRSWYLSHLIEALRTPTAASGDGDLSQQAAARELLGEVQFTFLMVLCLANYSCLEQWKRILSVLFTCRGALLKVEEYFVEAIRVLRVQLGRVEDVEGGLFELADEMSSRWLRRLLRGFRTNVEEVFGDASEEGMDKGSERGKGLRAALGDLEEWLNERYGWEDESNVLRKGMIQLEDGEMVEVHMDGADEEDETGDYAPVVVET
ncbi:hypothetical protein LTR70_005191 [Exophiala xenobiotica]|uniref:AAR2 splicing factor homolog n=1 Tax=Lithohypha guttulata TaxID=1690604 RepID=A0ABR0KB20_9EURO|nr:hypothetical protein LTR24_004740 [Lithohypha guttulata]KAK5318895.1 hypothetical protein LTR70_005191 [Exophiala xenobiotica]